MVVKEYIEIKVNGVVKINEPLIRENDDYKQLSDIVDNYKKRGFTTLTSNSPAPGYYILISDNEEKAVYIAYKLHYGNNIKDKNGRRIYKHSYLRFVIGNTETSEIYKLLFKESLIKEPKNNSWKFIHDDAGNLYIKHCSAYCVSSNYRNCIKIESPSFLKNFEIICANKTK